MNVIEKIKLALKALKLLKLLKMEKIMKDPKTTLTAIATAIVGIACIFLPIPEGQRAEIIAAIATVGVVIVGILAKDSASK